MRALFEGETIDFDHSDAHTNAMSDERINQKYARGEVRIVTEQARYPLNTIADLFSGRDYKMNPEFQRRHRWNAEQQSRLVESLIMNVPIPPIFLYEDQYSHYEVMDGLQRLTAIIKLYRDTLVLEGLEEWPELVGKRYSQLPEKVRRGIDRRYISSIILLHETARSEEEARRLKQMVFERINSGGVKLEAQESRNAVLNGPMNQLCLRLSRHPALCRTWAIPEPSAVELETGDPSDERLANPSYRAMEDAELVLRFFAMPQAKRKASLKDFLDAYLERANRFPPELLDKLALLFEDTISLAVALLGDKAFWICRQRADGSWHWPQRPTKMIYDALMASLSDKIAHKSALLSRKDQVLAALEKTYMDHPSDFEGVYRNASNLDRRIALIGAALDGVLSG